MTPLDDEELRGMLETRATRVAVDPVAVIADGRRRATAASASRPSVRRIVPSLAAFGAIVAIVAVVAALAMPNSVRPTGSATVSEKATPTVTPSPVPSEIEGAVTADELGRLLAERNMVGQIVFLDGELVPAPGACTASPWCGRAVVGLTTSHYVLPGEGNAALYLVDSNKTADLYAVRVGSTSPAGLVGLAVLGRMEANGATVLWPIETLAAGGSPKPPTQPQQVADLIEVTGWIVRTPLHPCPSTPGIPCAGFEDYLTARPYQPVQPDGSVLGPPAASSLFLQPGTYDDWAPDPTRRGSGVEPRAVTLLIRQIGPCPSTVRTLCVRPAGDLWAVVARLDPAP
jgi:hypothetical protein